MRKLLSLVMILALSFMFYACGSADEITWVGVESTNWGLGYAFDAKAGVSASSKQKGDIAVADITVSGTVDTDATGSYTLKYSVVGGDNQEYSKDRVVTVVDAVAPVISGASDIQVNGGADFDPKAGVKAHDPNAGNLDITDKIKIDDLDGFDSDANGDYRFKYSVTTLGGTTEVTRVVTVAGGLANGWFNYKYASEETRHTFFAAAESWLLNNGYAGIPLASQSGMTLLHERISLIVDDYVPVFGWGTMYADLSMDDAAVAAKNGGDFDLLGTEAQAGKYTFRTWNSVEPTTLNYYRGESTTESDYNSYISGSFYRIVLNAAKNGWEFAPELASSKPEPTDPKTASNGKIIAKEWSIPLRSNLEWAYNKGTDVAELDVLNPNHAKLTTEDFIYSARLALDEEWFRASSGGGSWVEMGIVGADDYATAVANGKSKDELDALWAKVGIKAVDNKLVFTFQQEKSEFDIFYGSASIVPIHEDLFKKYGDNYGDTTNHGATIASSGMYVIDYWEDGVGSRYSVNPKHPLASTISWTGETVKIMTGAEAQESMFTAFQAGKLDSVGIPTDRASEWKDDPDVLRTPGSSVWSLNINMAGTPEMQEELFPGSSYVPEPILGNKDFRMALYFSLNRNDMVRYDPKTYATGMKISDAYYVEPYSVPYRQTEQGLGVGEDLFYDTNGYNFDLALQLFKKAVADEIAAGNYNAGTADAPTVIDIEILSFDGASAAITDKWVNFAIEYFEKLEDTDNHVKLHFIIKRVAGSTIYDLIEEGTYDMALSSISGNTLDAASFLEIFCSDNRTGFLLNYGYDSNVPEIRVQWTEQGKNYDGIFSFDAIVEILNRNTLILNGVKATEFNSLDQLIDVEVQTLNEELEEIINNDVTASLMEFFLGDVDALIEEEGLDDLHSVMIVTKNGTNRLLMVSEVAGVFEVYYQVDLNTDIRREVRAYMGGWDVTKVSPIDENNFATELAPYLAEGTTWEAFAQENLGEGDIFVVVEAQHADYGKYVFGIWVYSYEGYYIAYDDATIGLQS